MTYALSPGRSSHVAEADRSVEVEAHPLFEKIAFLSPRLQSDSRASGCRRLLPLIWPRKQPLDPLRANGLTFGPGRPARPLRVNAKILASPSTCLAPRRVNPPMFSLRSFASRCRRACWIESRWSRAIFVCHPTPQIYLPQPHIIRFAMPGSLSLNKKV